MRRAQLMNGEFVINNFHPKHCLCGKSEILASSLLVIAVSICRGKQWTHFSSRRRAIEKRHCFLTSPLPHYGSWWHVHIFTILFLVSRLLYKRMKFPAFVPITTFLLLLYNAWIIILERQRRSDGLKKAHPKSYITFYDCLMRFDNISVSAFSVVRRESDMCLKLSRFFFCQRHCAGKKWILGSKIRARGRRL